jgi:hypothetical protein
MGRVLQPISSAPRAAANAMNPVRSLGENRCVFMAVLLFVSNGAAARLATSHEMTGAVFQRHAGHR